MQQTINFTPTSTLIYKKNCSVLIEPDYLKGTVKYKFSDSNEVIETDLLGNHSHYFMVPGFAECHRTYFYLRNFKPVKNV